MHRRSLLRAGVAVTGSVVLGGCLGSSDVEPPSNPSVPEDRPDGSYIPSHVSGMEMIGVAQQGEYTFGAMYTTTHEFWTVNGDSVSHIEDDIDEDIHLMASVWDPETRTVLPDTGLSVEIYQDDSLVSQETIYPMLSQRMGFHYGSNFELNGDGEYTVRLSVGGMSTRRSGAFRNRFTEPATVEIPFEYSHYTKEGLMFERTDAPTARSGAVDPVDMEMIPESVAPSDLPGRVIGTGMSNDARLVVTALDSPPAGIDGEKRYLAVSVRTRYNRILLPAMGLEGTLSRGTDTVYDGEFTRTLDPELKYHYGAVVDSVDSGDELTLGVTVQPQAARHIGYETAFGGLMGGMDDVTITV